MKTTWSYQNANAQRFSELAITYIKSYYIILSNFNFSARLEIPYISPKKINKSKEINKLLF